MAVGEERRLVTVLFADIVGSTDLSLRADPEVVRETLRATFAKLRDIIERHGGTVEKFIGDEVMAVFGAPIAHEDDAERAVRAAFAMGAAPVARGPHDHVALQLRIGVNTGEVVSGGEGAEFLVTGQPVNAAARIRQAAAPGEVLVGSITRELTAGAVRYGDSRALEAKGIGALEAWPALALVSDVPVRIHTRRAPFIGRDEELRLLLELERRVHTDRRAYLVTVFGQAGVGKSRLAAEFAESVGRERVRVGRCLPYGEAIAFWPLREILQADAGIAASDGREEALRKLRAAVFAAFGGASDAEPTARRLAVLAGLSTRDAELADVPPANLAQELRWGLRRYLERRAGKPLVIVVEDLQWADPALLDTIDNLAEWTRAPLLFVCLARPELLEVRPGWGGGRTNATALALRPLREDEARRLVEALSRDATLPAEVRDEIVRRAEGNPLYLEEYVRTLSELRELGPRAGAAIDRAELVRLALPPTLQGLIAARLDRLSAEVRETLRRAAVFGRVFSKAALSALGPAPLPIDECLAEAARRELIVESEEAMFGGGAAYRFRHALTREVAYRGVPKALRWRMHDACARWLEGAAGDRLAEHADLIAYHAEQAFLLGRELGAPESETLGPRAFDLLLAAATRWRRAGLLRAALGVYDRAASVGAAADVDEARLVEAQGFAALARYYVQGARTALAQLDMALAAARACGPSEVLVRLASQRAFIARLESPEASAALFAEGIAAARATGDPELIAHATLMSNAQPWLVGDLDEHLRVLSEADGIMSTSGIVSERGIALSWLATNGLQRGDFQAALAYLEEAEALARASGSRFQLWAAKRAAARDALAMGDLGAALAHAEDALALAHEVGARRLVGLSCARLGDVLYESGELARSRAILEQGLASLDPDTMGETLVETQWKLARTCLALGDAASARTYAEASVKSSAPTDLYSKVTSAAALAAVRATEGDAVQAEALYREALATAERTGYGALTAEVRRELGAFLLGLARAEEARTELEAARAFYGDALAVRRRERIDVLLARTEVASR